MLSMHKPLCSPRTYDLSSEPFMRVQSMNFACPIPAEGWNVCVHLVLYSADDAQTDKNLLKPESG